MITLNPQIMELKNMNKKTIISLGIITLLAFLLISSVSALDTTKNKTIDMNGIKVCVPESDNGTITNISDSNGNWVYTYDDEKNKITIYVSDIDMPEFKLGQEEYDSTYGYHNMVMIKDKYVLVGSEYKENKDFMLSTIYELNPV